LVFFYWFDKIIRYKVCHSSESWNPEIMKNYHIFILASARNGTLYIGITSDLVKRVYQHKNKILEGFTSKYGVDRLVYFEITNDANSALAKEKQLKALKRKWKLELIEKNNPNWEDLYLKILDPESSSE